MKKIVITLTGMVLGWTGFAQNINYELEIKNFQQIGCDDGIGDDEEPTWKIWATDNHTVGSQKGTNSPMHDRTRWKAGIQEDIMKNKTQERQMIANSQPWSMWSCTVHPISCVCHALLYKSQGCRRELSHVLY